MHKLYMSCYQSEVKSNEKGGTLPGTAQTFSQEAPRVAPQPLVFIIGKTFYGGFLAHQG